MNKKPYRTPYLGTPKRKTISHKDPIRTKYVIIKVNNIIKIKSFTGTHDEIFTKADNLYRNCILKIITDIEEAKSYARGLYENQL